MLGLVFGLGVGEGILVGWLDWRDFAFTSACSLMIPCMIDLTYGCILVFVLRLYYTCILYLYSLILLVSAGILSRLFAFSFSFLFFCSLHLDV